MWPKQVDPRRMAAQGYSAHDLDKVQVIYAVAPDGSSAPVELLVVVPDAADTHQGQVLMDSVPSSSNDAVAQSANADAESQPQPSTSQQLVQSERFPWFSYGVLDQMTGANTQEDILRFKNGQMELQLKSRERREEELRRKIFDLEMKEQQRETFIGCFSRHWSKVNVSIIKLLRVLEGEGEHLGPAEYTDAIDPLLVSTSTMTLTSLSDQIKSTSTILSKIMVAFDQLDEHRHKILISLKRDCGFDPHAMPQFATAVKSHQIINLQMSEVQDNLGEAQSKIQDYEQQLQTAGVKSANLIAMNQKMQEKVREIQNAFAKMKNDMDIAAREKKRIEQETMQRQIQLNNIEIQVQKEREENQYIRELGKSRQVEVEAMKGRQQRLELELKNLKLKNDELFVLGAADVLTTPAYANLQTKFSIMYTELLRMRQQTSATRAQYQQVSGTFQRHVNEMQKKTNLDEADLQRQVEATGSSLNTIRLEYRGLMDKSSPLKEEVGQNELISGEMRSLLPTLQDHNRKLNEDVVVYKKKCQLLKVEEKTLKEKVLQMEKEVKELPQETNPSISTSNADSDTSLIKQLQDELAKGQAENEMLKFQLNAHRTIEKDGRSYATLAKADAKAKAELEELKMQLKELEKGPTKEEKKKLTNEQANSQINSLENQIRNLKAAIGRGMANEKALSEEMEARGLNYDNLLVQASRLREELAKTNTKNLMIMSQGNKIEEMTKQQRDVIKLLYGQVQILRQRLAHEENTAKQLEEKTNDMTKSLVLGELEGRKQYSTSEQSRLSLLETIHVLSELQDMVNMVKVHWERLPHIVACKKARHEAAFEENKTVEQEVERLEREVEQLNAEAEAALEAKKTPSPSSTKLGMTRQISEFKAIVACPSCKVARKDAFLSTCFHTFCYECLLKRYKARDRKCPQCQKAFGADDYHRLQLK